MGLCVSVYVSFSCNSSFASLCMWNCSSVFMSRPFISRCNMLSVSSIVPSACSVSRICCAYLDVLLLVLVLAKRGYYFTYFVIIYATGCIHPEYRDSCRENSFVELHMDEVFQNNLQCIDFGLTVAKIAASTIRELDAEVLQLRSYK
jgi:hypothetical protein